MRLFNVTAVEIEAAVEIEPNAVLKEIPPLQLVQLLSAIEKLIVRPKEVTPA